MASIQASPSPSPPPTQASFSQLTTFERLLMQPYFGDDDDDDDANDEDMRSENDSLFD